MQRHTIKNSFDIINAFTVFKDIYYNFSLFIMLFGDVYTEIFRNCVFFLFLFFKDIFLLKISVGAYNHN